MKKLVVATNNAHKLEEIAAILGDEMELLSLKDIQCFDEIPETADTLEGNARQKAQYIYTNYGMDCFADDTGLEVEALNGAPGVYSARYAPKGQECAKLIEEMKNIPDNKRTASFQCVIAYIDEKSSFTVSGSCCGSIGYEEKGTNGFGYDPVFVVGDKTMAEMTAEEKNELSHRGAALRALCEKLKG